MNTDVLGTYLITYSTTNALGAVATATRTVVVGPGQPVVSTLPASGMVNDTVTLNGMVNPSGADTMAWFEWGTTTYYGNVTTVTRIGSVLGAEPVSTLLSGLTFNLTYYYRITASNSFGQVYGSRSSFLIPSVTSLADSGPGSLREAIANAAWGMSIVLTNSGAITLTSGELVVNKKLNIEAPERRPSPSVAAE